MDKFVIDLTPGPNLTPVNNKQSNQAVFLELNGGKNAALQTFFHVNVSLRGLHKRIQMIIFQFS